MTIFNRNIALGGTGTLAYCCASAYKELRVIVKPLSFCCTSGGGFVGALASLGFTPDDIIETLKMFDLSKLQDKNLIPIKGFLKGKKILEALEKVIGKATFKDCSIPLIITACEYPSKKLVYFCKENTPNLQISEALRSSISIPVLFEPYQINDKQYMDGGVIDNLPLNYYEDSSNLIGIKIESSFINKNRLDNIIDISLASIEMLMIALEKKHIEDSKYSKLIKIQSNYSGLSFNHSENDISKMIQESKIQARDQINKLFFR